MKKAVFYILFLLFLSSCIKEEIDPSLISTNLKLQPAIAVPIGYLNMSLDKYLADSLKPEQLTEDSTGFFTLFYHQNVYSLRADEFLTFNHPISQSNSFSNNTGSDIDLSIIPSNLKYYDTIRVNLNFDNSNGERIDSVKIEKADLNFSVNSSYNIQGDLKITIPQISKNGVKYTKTTQINGFNTANQLVGYTLNPSFRNDSNVVELIIEATVQNSNVTIPNSSTFINYSLELSNLDYSVIYGYLGKQTITLDEQSFDLPFFEKIMEGSFHFEQPELKIKFENSFGFPLSFSFSRFDASTKNKGSLQVSGASFPVSGNPFTLKYPNMGQVGQAINDSLTLNPQNTNLFDVLEALPTQIVFAADAQANAQTNNYNFITDSSRLQTDVEISLPMYGNASVLVLQDTMDFRLSDFYDPNTQSIKKLSFTLNFINSFPVAVDAQIYFYDENRQLIDSLFTTPFSLPGGEDIDGDGKTDATKSDAIIVEIDKDKISKIENTYYLLNKGRVHTTNSDKNPPENVKFYSDYALRADLGAIFELEELSINN